MKKYNVTYVYEHRVITFTVEASDALGVVRAAHEVMDPMGHNYDQVGAFIEVQVEEADTFDEVVLEWSPNFSEQLPV
tara:strand:+ start:553 stop:783 length:231 start_codon:yes stop_codon:yes gene_type:complete